MFTSNSAGSARAKSIVDTGDGVEAITGATGVETVPVIDELLDFDELVSATELLDREELVNATELLEREELLDELVSAIELLEREELLGVGATTVIVFDGV